MHIKIKCDNTNCRKPVKEFKIKLYRFFAGNDDGFTSVESDDYEHVERYPGCAANARVERDYSFKIPDTQPSF